MEIEQVQHTDEKEILKNKIIDILKQQGFVFNPTLRPAKNTKEWYKKLQEKARLEQLSIHRNFLLELIGTIKMFSRDGIDIDPKKIELELLEVKEGSLEQDIFRWWNFVWWSIPYQRPYGRQMRFLLWDKAHDLPFGLISLQSPILRLSVRDKSLAIPREELDIWINKSLNAQRVGAFPPYNELIGGKMVALAMTCNELRKKYEEKYRNYSSILKKRNIDSRLLFITTTSAFGKSSMYDRLKYNDEIVAKSLGYTKGYGSFHFSEDLYEEIIQFLQKKGEIVGRGYGNGPSRKLKILKKGIHNLGLNDSFVCHGVQREFYLFPLVRNLKEVITEHQTPVWFERPFVGMQEYWKRRWALPRSVRTRRWKRFKAHRFFEEVEAELISVKND